MFHRVHDTQIVIGRQRQKVKHRRGKAAQAQDFQRQHETIVRQEENVDVGRV